jgi:hypothetical protein
LPELSSEILLEIDQKQPLGGKEEKERRGAMNLERE